MGLDGIVSSVADELPVGVWVARAPGGEFLYANQAFAEIMGMGARSDVARGEYAEPYGICTRDGKPYPEDRMPFVRALEARQTVVVDDIVIHRADGGRVSIRAQARPVFDDAGEITHVVIAFIDITREAQAEAARAESEARLRQMQRMESIGTLAGGIAHDFNNLLAAVKMLASMLKSREQEPDKLDYLDQIDRVTDSASQLTRALLGFARRGRPSSAAPVSLHEVIDAVTTLMRRTVGRRIEIDTRLEAISPEVLGDFSQLEQVVLNLVVNARDAMPDGGRITVRTRDGLAAGRPAVVLEVGDEGPGIDRAIRDRVFEPYFTTKGNGDGGGAGLGLATVWGIVEGHGGAIDVDDAAPHGALMRVTLPAAPVQTASSRHPRGAALVVPGGGRVLVVDDDRIVRDATAAVLRDIGYDVVCAASGRDALEILRQRAHEIDGVLLDMVMPGMDGRATYLAMRDLRADLPVLLTTGYALDEEASRVRDLGVRHFLVKPFSVEELSTALAAVLSSARSG